MIPSTSPVFLTLVGVHVAFGLAAVVFGAAAMLSRKGRGRHPRFGSIYYWCLTAVVALALALAAMRWAHAYHLAVLGVLSFAAATLGRQARRRRWRGWTPVHITGMAASYVLMLTAFYVDNGPHLPLWNRLPDLAFWLLPTAVGAPITLWALWRYGRRRSGAAQARAS